MSDLATGEPSTRWPGVVLAVVLALAGPSGRKMAAAAPPRPVHLSTVPPAARQAAQRAVPGARFARASRLADQGGPKFVLAGQDLKGHAVEVTATARGQVQRVETTVSMGEVPARVRTLARGRAQKWKFTRIKAVVEFDGDRRTEGYEFEGPNRAGETMVLLDVLISRS